MTPNENCPQHKGINEKCICEPQKEKSWEERFDEKFVDKIKNINGGFAYEELKFGEQQDVEELRDFIRTELQNSYAKGQQEARSHYYEKAVKACWG